MDVGTVALRQQMSNLRHSIRHQTAQLQNLEKLVLVGPRPLPPGMMGSPPHSPTESISSDITQTPTHARISRRPSREVLHGLAGSESSLPLPRRDSSRTRTSSQDGMDGIREGIPSRFGASGSGHRQRNGSPTRSLSRMSFFSVILSIPLYLLLEHCA